MFGVKGFAKGLAKAQLRSFLAYRSKYPDMSADELYVAAIKTRPGWSEEEILRIIKTAKNIHSGYNFQRVVIILAADEYAKRIGEFPDTKTYKKLTDGVTMIIPANM